MTDVPFTPAQVRALCDALGIPWKPGQPEPPTAEVVRAAGRMRARADVPAETADVLDRTFLDLADE